MIYLRSNTEKRVEKESLRTVQQQTETEIAEQQKGEADETERYFQTLEKVAVASAALLETIEKVWNMDKVVTTKNEN